MKTKKTYKNHKGEEYEPEIDDPLAAIAQGVINIDSGLTTIEQNSRVYAGMLKIIELRQTGKLILSKEK